MRYPGETDSNTTFVVTGCFNLYQLIPDVRKAQGTETRTPFHNPLDSNRAPSTLVSSFWISFPEDPSIR